MHRDRHPTAAAQEASCARTILRTLARKAFRHPVANADIQPLYDFYVKARKGSDFEGGIQAAIEAMLVSPEFLFRIEQDPLRLRAADRKSAPARQAESGKAYRISDVELASRLSFFLWSSIPDDQLLNLAIQGKLKDAGVFEQQVKRMLGDERSKALLNNFFGQWLLVRNIATVTIPRTAAAPMRISSWLDMIHPTNGQRSIHWSW